MPIETEKMIEKHKAGYMRKPVKAGEFFIYNAADIHINFDKTDKIYIAEVKELPGCIAHGNTRQEALTNVEIVISNWLAVADENNWEIPNPKKAALAV